MILDHNVLLWCYELLKNNGDGWNFFILKERPFIVIMHNSYKSKNVNYNVFGAYYF